MNSRRFIAMTPNPRTMRSIAYADDLVILSRKGKAEEALQCLDVRKVLTVYARCAFVGAALSISMGQDGHGRASQQKRPAHV